MNLEKANQDAVALGNPDLMAACQIALYSLTPAQAAIVLLKELFDLCKVEIAGVTARGLYLNVMVKVWVSAEKWVEIETQGITMDTAMVSLLREAVKRGALF